MESALIVSGTDKGITYFTDLLTTASIGQIVALSSCSEARRVLLERDFDLVIVNAPLRDESGIEFAQRVASQGVSQIVLIVKNEYFDAVSSACEEYGVLTVPKPVDKAFFWSAIKLAGAAQNKLKRMQVENSKLKQKIEDIRIVDRAKCLLISYQNMSEQEAHRCIEKQAMDMRATRREIAERILRTYKN
ncbi:MAG: ANTAR domain-containing protein [Clostridiales bacterium]|nr:ANTAR domain-containing protein [Clostridiales bacterium]